MEYNWKVVKLEAKTINDVQGAIFHASWIKTGINDQGIEGSYQGTTEFNNLDPLSESFIPFEQLTEEIILDWVKKEINNEYENFINELIENEINSKITTYEVNFPWTSQ